MATYAIIQESGLAPETRGLKLYVDPEASWASPGGPGYTDVDPA